MEVGGALRLRLEAQDGIEDCAVEGAGRKLEIDNAEGVHINFRHFRHFSSL